MNYEFPIISNIDDVLPYIKDAPEFIVVEKDGYTVINYVVMSEDTFPTVEYVPTRHAAMVRRECRGLIFSKDGKLINRRFHKFFNVNERDETRMEAIDWSKPHRILEKLDGSMVSPCYVGGHVRWMTKMGITDTSMEAELFVAKNPKYSEFAENILKQGFTPIFEWCSNKNRIVLDYPEDNLVLTAIRHNESGQYVPHHINKGNGWVIPAVKAYSYDSKNILEIIRQQEDTEGVVVRFDDGHMVKVKSEWYVRIHKIKALLGNERDVVAMILNNQVDDIIPVLPKEDIEKIKVFEISLMKRMQVNANTLSILVQSNRDIRDRKTFAIEAASNFSPMWRSLIFKFWDESAEEGWTYQAIHDMVLRHCGSNQSYQKIKNDFLKDVDYE